MKTFVSRSLVKSHLVASFGTFRAITDDLRNLVEQGRRTGEMSDDRLQRPLRRLRDLLVADIAWLTAIANDVDRGWVWSVDDRRAFLKRYASAVAEMGRALNEAMRTDEERAWVAVTNRLVRLLALEEEARQL